MNATVECFFPAVTKLFHLSSRTNPCSFIFLEARICIHIVSQPERFFSSCLHFCNSIRFHVSHFYALSFKVIILRLYTKQGVNKKGVKTYTDNVSTKSAKKDSKHSSVFSPLLTILCSKALSNISK